MIDIIIIVIIIVIVIVIIIVIVIVIVIVIIIIIVIVIIVIVIIVIITAVVGFYIALYNSITMPVCLTQDLLPPQRGLLSPPDAKSQHPLVSSSFTFFHVDLRNKVCETVGLVTCKQWAKPC